MGKDVVLNYRTRYLYTFSCSFEFYSFPFDTQLCNIKFSLLPPVGSACAPVFSGRKNKIVSSEEVISMYSIDQLRYTNVSESDDMSTITIKILFRRKYDSYLLTTFLPCIVLYILGVLTMTSFHLDNFGDRIGVTLSLLIVVASLFSQVVSTLPASPTPKCLEWFFFLIIVKLAFIFVLHTIVAHSIRRGRKHQSLDLYLKTRDSKTNIIAQGIQDSQEYESDFIPKNAVTANRLGIIISLAIAAICIAALVMSVIMERSAIEKKFKKATASFHHGTHHAHSIE